MVSQDFLSESIILEVLGTELQVNMVLKDYEVDNKLQRIMYKFEYGQNATTVF